MSGKKNSAPAKVTEVTWEVDIDGKWFEYDAAVQRRLEKAFLSSTECIHEKMGPWDMNLKNMTQTNTESGKVRSIRRQGPQVDTATSSSAAKAVAVKSGSGVKKSTGTARSGGSAGGGAGGSAKSSAAAVDGGKKVKKMSMKEQILALVATAPKPVSLQAIKKDLLTHGFIDSARFKTQVNATLKALTDEDRADFGKTGGSYHGGPTSASYLSDAAVKEAEAEAREHQENGDIDCPWCGSWSPDHDFVGEDSIARGGEFVCDSCGKTFWTWISDGYNRGHEVEYRRSKDYL